MNSDYNNSTNPIQQSIFHNTETGHEISQEDIAKCKGESNGFFARDLNQLKKLLAEGAIITEPEVKEILTKLETEPETLAVILSYLKEAPNPKLSPLASDHEFKASDVSKKTDRDLGKIFKNFASKLPDIKEEIELSVHDQKPMHSLSISPSDQKKINELSLKPENAHLSKVELHKLMKDERNKKFEEAKLAAGTLGYAFHFKVERLGLSVSDPVEKKMLFELAKLNAGCHSQLDTEIKKYGFDPSNPEDQKLLEEIALIASKHLTISSTIKNFGVTDKSVIAEIAMNQAYDQFSSLPSNIKLYGFDASIPEEKQYLVQIAKIAAEKSPHQLAQAIQLFGFDASNPEDRKALDEIFDIAFASDPDILEHFENFGIQDMDRIFELAMDVARKMDPEDISDFNPLAFVDLDDPEGQRRFISLFMTLHANDPSEALELYNELEFPEDEEPLSSFKSLISLFESDVDEDDVEEHMEVLESSLSDVLFSRFENMLNSNDASLKKTNLPYLTCFICHALISPNKKQYLKNMDTLDLLTSFEKIYDPSLRMALVPALAEVLTRSDLTDTKNTFSQIPILLVQSLNNPDKKVMEREKTAILNLKTSLKAGYTNKALLRTLLALKGTTTLSPENICSLIEFCLKEPKRSNVCASNLNMLTAILDLGGEDLLVRDLNDPEFNSIEDFLSGADASVLNLASILEEAFKRKVPALAGIEGCSEKLMATFQTSRRPTAIFEYVASLEKIENTELRDITQKALGEFIISVLNGTFSEDRISLDGNPHLQALHDNHPEIFKKWIDRNPEIDNKVVEIQGKKHRISRTSAPQEILHCGTEVAGSCQNINGDPELNRGLLGYALNGHQMIELKKENPNIDQEAIVGRAVFRLLIVDGKPPVLQLETIYPKTLDDASKEEIKNYAREYAQKLGCALISSTEGDSKKPFEGKAQSLGGRAPEYVDAITGISENGIYSVTRANYV